MANSTLTDLSSLGEFGLINKIKENVKVKHQSTIKGIDDDAAVLDLTAAKTVVTTDMLVEGVHFDLAYVPLKHLGYKSVVVNVSDVYAMNAIPTQVLVSIAISNRFSLEAIQEFYAGVHLACEIYGVDLVGGDTTSSQKGLTISVTAIGHAEENKITYRNAAKANQLICVTGNIGAAYMGLQLLEREKLVFADNPNQQPDFTGYEYILERQLKPEARKDIIEKLENAGIQPRAMMDISDGLSSELIHICKQSGVGCKIFEERLPIHEQTSRMAEELNLDPTIVAMNGGEDYELLFTADTDELKKLETIEDVHIIGHIITDQQMALFTRSGAAVAIQAQGWNAF